jgi:hypothetical protein
MLPFELQLPRFVSLLSCQLLVLELLLLLDPLPLLILLSAQLLLLLQMFSFDDGICNARRSWRGCRWEFLGMDRRGCGTAYFHARGRAIRFRRLNARCRPSRIPRNGHQRRGRSHAYRRGSSGGRNWLDLMELSYG